MPRTAAERMEASMEQLRLGAWTYRHRMIAQATYVTQLAVRARLAVVSCVRRQPGHGCAPVLPEWSARRATNATPFDAPDRFVGVGASIFAISATAYATSLPRRLRPDCHGASCSVCADMPHAEWRFRCPVPSDGSLPERSSDCRRAHRAWRKRPGHERDAPCHARQRLRARR